MRERYLRAIDLRGYPSPLYEKTVRVLSLEGIEKTEREKGNLYGVEVTEIRDIRRIPKGFFRVFRGCDRRKNRAALEENIDMLACPYPLDYVMAGLAAKKSIAFEVNISDIIAASGYARMRLLQNLKDAVTLALKYKALLVITSGATKPEEVKNPRVLVAFGRVLGLDYPQAKSCIYNLPRKVLEGIL